MGILNYMFMIVTLSVVIFIFMCIRQMITVDMLGDGILGRGRIFLPFLGLAACGFLFIKMMQIESIAGTILSFAAVIAIDVWFVLNGRKIKARVADMNNKFAFYDQYKSLGLSPYHSEEEAKQVEEIAKQYGIEYDDIKKLVSDISLQYDIVQKKKKAMDDVE